MSKGLLTVGGDGRADSPGYSAKYGCYGIIDMSSNKVIHIWYSSFPSWQKTCVILHDSKNFEDNLHVRLMLHKEYTAHE